MKKTFFTLLIVTLTFKIFAQQSKTETVYFDYDKYDLTIEATTTLENYYKKIKDKEFVHITIIGHTDADGGDTYNITLSQNRTKTVFDYFLSKGISSDKIKIQFYGETVSVR